MDNALLPEESNENRSARMSVLTWHPKEGEALNLFTHIRHRRGDTMGPWVGKPDHIWHTTEFPASEIAGNGEIRIHRIDAPLTHCLQLVENILDENCLVAGDHEVRYALEQPPRIHWAYRNHIRPDNHSVSSPFTKHSAKVFEFWSFAPEPRDYWRKVSESYMSHQMERPLGSLGFRLDQRLDRVGNLMIAGAADEIDCELVSKQNHLILSVNSAGSNDLLQNAYYATVWARDSEDDLVQQHLEIDQKDTVINVDSAMDQIGLAIYRRRDGQCIDMREATLIQEINIGLTMATGQSLDIHDSRRGTTNTVSIGDAKSIVKVDNERSNALDRTIRQAVLGRRSWQRDRDARQQGNLGRFGPDQTKGAIDFFLKFLADHWGSEGPIYLADPYFMQRDFDNTDDRIYSSLFGLTKGQSLRILCGQQNANAWLSKYPSVLTNHVAVRSFTSKDNRGQDKPSFHDRYLIMPDKEIIITHSINGWHDQGVTFATLPYEVYRAEAEELWSMNMGQNSNGVYVREVN